MNWLAKLDAGICITSACNKPAMSRYRTANDRRYPYSHCEDHQRGWVAADCAEELKSLLAAGLAVVIDRQSPCLPPPRPVSKISVTTIRR